MKKIRLCDADLEFFDMEISPSEFKFFQKHRDVFRCMWKEQDKPFWKRFIITFRSCTVKHGIIKQISCDTPKFENILDEAFIFIHEQFVDGKETVAKNFIEDTARLAQNQDKLQYLDSKSFAKDPFYIPDTREVFRRFFGPPNQKTSLLKVYILTPIYLRFGGSVCRCLIRWIEAPLHDPKDDSYWIPLSNNHEGHSALAMETIIALCTECREEFSEKFFREKLSGKPEGPKFVNFWTLGDPRFNDKKNPLYSPNSPRGSDWRDELSIAEYLKLCKYVTLAYAPESKQCKTCKSILGEDGDGCSVYGHSKKRKKKNKKKSKKDDTEIEELVDQINGKMDFSPTTMAHSAMNDTSLPKAKSTDAEKLKKRRRVFSSKARITDEIKHGIAAGTNPGKAENLMGSFKVYKIIEDDCMEMTITVALLRNEEKFQHLNSSVGPLPDGPLSGPFLRSKIKGLPELFEWWEGLKWCVAVFNYELEEKNVCAKPTNFSIKVTGLNEEAMRRNMLKFVFYVAKRKRRYCPGWVIAEDDIVTCIFPDEYSTMKGLTVCIQKGFRFEERMSEEEKNSLNKYTDPFIPKKKKILMTLDADEAKALIQGADGKEKMRELMKRLDNVEETDDEILPFGDGCKLHLSKDSPPVIDARNMLSETVPENESDEPIWDQMEKNPENFCLFVLVDVDKTHDLVKYGMKALNLKELGFTRARKWQKCQKCKQPKSDCTCDKTTFVDQLVKTALASKLDLPDNDETGSKFGNELLNSIKKANPDWCSDAEEKVPLPPLHESVTKSEDAFDDLPPLVDAKHHGKPVGTASIFPAAAHKKNVVVNNDSPMETGVNTSMPPSSVRIGEMGSGVQINVGSQVPSSSIKHSQTHVKTSFSISSSSSTQHAGQNIGRSQLKSGIAEARSTINEYNVPNRNGQFSVRVETRSSSGQLTNNFMQNEGAIPLPFREQPLPNPNGIEITHLKHGPGAPKGNNSKSSSDAKQTGRGINIAIKTTQSRSTMVHVHNTEGVATHVYKDASGSIKMACNHHAHVVHTCSKSQNGPGQGSRNGNDQIPRPCPLHNHNRKVFHMPHSQQVPPKTSDVNTAQQVIRSEECIHSTSVTEPELTQNIESEEVKKPEGEEDQQDESVGVSDEVKNGKPTTNLRICAKCGEQEPEAKKFKKCQKCKAESVANARYYCGRDCQVADWNDKHKMEHKEKRLG